MQSSTTTQAPTASADLMNALRELSGMHAAGMLDVDEFKAAKQKLLGM